MGYVVANQCAPAHQSHARRKAFICVSLIALLALVASACIAAPSIDPKTRGLLDFIGSIEGPVGYDDYYQAASAAPPKPLTQMKVSEVLAWQDSIAASSASQSAGRYQIAPAALRDFVRTNALDPNTTFNAAIQDQVAAQMLHRRGWRPDGTDHSTMGNAIAYEWSALPICSGIRTGRSAYDGLLGNSTLTTCDAFREVLKNGGNPSAVAWALAQSTIGTGGTGGQARVHNALDDFMRNYKSSLYGIAATLSSLASNLLFSLMLIEWLWTTGQAVARGAGVGNYLMALAYRVALGGAFLFIINLGDYSDLIIRSADGLIGQTSSGASINVIDIFDRVLAKSFELFGRSWYSIVDKFSAMVVLFLGAIIVALIIISYMEVYLAFAAAIVVLGFGGFSATRQIAINYLQRALGRVFRLFTALVCAALISVLLSTEMSSDNGDAILLVGMMVILVFIIITVPAAVEQTVMGSASISSSETLGKMIQAVPQQLAKKAMKSGG